MPGLQAISIPSLSRTRSDDHGLLAVKPFSSRSASSGERGGSKAGNAKGKAVAAKPWADQPWQLMEVPSRTQRITHPALHVANECAHIHNAMLRGLNAIYLQAPHVREAQDIADLLFLTQSWSAWLLDHHDLKESTMLPGFEAVLGVPTGTLTLAATRRRTSPAPSVSSSSISLDVEMATTKSSGNSKDAEEEGEIYFLLHRVYAYASATHKDPHVYDAVTLRTLLAALADVLVPHLTAQVGLLASMREMCLGAAAVEDTTKNDISARLPIPMVTITRTPSNVLTSPASASPPVSPTLSTFSSASSTSSASSSASPPRKALSLYPSTTTRPYPSTDSKNNPMSTSKPRNLDVIDTEAGDRLARARALFEADDRANKLMHVYLAADASASAAMDRFVVPPMMVRLRDVTFTSSPSLSTSSSFSSLSSQGSSSSTGRGGGRSSVETRGVGGGNNTSDWPRMSVLAIHAVADKLSPRFAGAWRFLPCDVWGRPRELPFMGA